MSRSALIRNHKILGKLAGRAALIPVVKADGYGLGADWVAKTLRLRSLAVMTVPEGVKLRASGFRGQIQLLSPALGSGLKLALGENLVPSVSSQNQLKDLEREASRRGKVVSAQAEVNTGMNRLGCEPWELPGLAAGFKGRLSLAGVYTHFARAAEDSEDSPEAAAQFKLALRLAGLEGISAHASASAALVRHGSFGFSHARPGLALYGADPTPGKKKIFSPVLSLKARILQLRRVPAGAWVSYGRSFRTKKSIRLAVLGLGYADGWRRILTNQAEALVQGRRVPLVGRVCMDMVMADVSSLAKVAEGEAATLIGSFGNESILVEEVAKRAGTISYEILTGIGRRVPRIPVS